MNLLEQFFKGKEVEVIYPPEPDYEPDYPIIDPDQPQGEPEVIRRKGWAGSPPPPKWLIIISPFIVLGFILVMIPIIHAFILYYYP